MKKLKIDFIYNNNIISYININETKRNEIKYDDKSFIFLERFTI